MCKHSSVHPNLQSPLLIASHSFSVDKFQKQSAYKEKFGTQVACTSLITPGDAAIFELQVSCNTRPSKTHLGAFERHVLQEVSCAIVDFGLISAASINPDSNCSCVCEGPGLRSHTQSTWQSRDLRIRDISDNRHYSTCHDDSAMVA